MNRKGYVRLSALVLVLIAALYAVSVYNSKPVSARLGCYFDPYGEYTCGYCTEFYDMCSDVCSGAGYSVCTYNSGQCVGQAVAFGQCCRSSGSFSTATIYGCTGCPSGYHFASGCNVDGYASCAKSCGPGEAQSGCGCIKLLDPCSPNPCNSPPADYCLANGVRRYYTSPGTCTGPLGGSATCKYSYNDYQCYGSTGGCWDANTKWKSSCGSVCFRELTNCGSDYNTCSGTSVVRVDNYCGSGDCRQSTSIVQDCAASSGWVDTSGCYGACSGTTSITQKNQEYRSYTCSGDSCSYSVTQTRATTCSTGANCAASTGWYDTSSCTGACSGSTPITQKTQQYRSYTCSGAGSCSYSVTDNQAVTCTTGSACAPWTCNGATLCTGGYCTSGSCAAPGSCSTCQPSAPTCVSGSTLRTYSAGCGSGSCNSQASYSDTNCPSGVCDSSSTPNKCSDYRDCSYLNGWYNNGGSYACCPSGTQTGTCQNQELRSYAPAVTCSASTGYSVTNTQTLTSGVTTCSTNSPTCADINTRTTYTASCTGSGVCTNTASNSACGAGSSCIGGTCINPCSPNPCNSPTDNVCAKANTLTVYSNPGVCTNNAGSASCNYGGTPQACTYGCLSLVGPDTCAPNTPPTLTGLTLTGASGAYAKSGQTVTMVSVGNDPNGENVRLECGTSSGAADLCTSGYVASGALCSFTNAFADSSDHTVYCQLRDSASAVSTIRTATLSADNSPPTVALARSPSGAQLTPGTSVMLTATAGDTRSGISTMHIVVDGFTASTCSSGVCTYTFTPSYGNHTYYANAFDNVGNAAWAFDSSGSQTGGGPSGNGTAPGGGTTPGNGTTSPPCSSNCPGPIVINNAPNVNAPIYFTGQCKSGSTITLHCNATDVNQATPLSVGVWAGQCSALNCFNTRSWASGSGTTYFTNSPMAGNGEYTINLLITQQTLTGIAATCAATDALGAVNSPSTQGDNYNPLCVVDSCLNPPTITVNSLSPTTAVAGKIRVNFTLSFALSADPLVTIKPGSQIGGTATRNGNLVSKVGTSYVYEIDVQQSDLNGIADISIGGTYIDTGVVCPASKLLTATIDTQPPTTSVLCGGAACQGTYINTAPVVSLACSDLTGCKQNTTVYSTSGSGGMTQYTAPFTFPVLTGLTTYNIRYHSTDTLNQNESDKTTSISVYGSPCVNQSQEPACQQRITEEVIVRVALNKTNAISGSTFNSYMYCFLRDAASKNKTRDCVISKISVLVDKGKPNQKDYFSYYRNGVFYTSPATYSPDDVKNYITQHQESCSDTGWSTDYDSASALNYDPCPGRTIKLPEGTYKVDKRIPLPISTVVFRSDFCVNGTDSGTNLSGEWCDGYNVTSSELSLGVTFPDVGVTVPLTTDGLSAPNFTRLMPINFAAKPIITTAFTTNACTGDACKVEFSFDAPLYNRVAQWNAFDNAYTPSAIDIASNNFACDQYRTLYVRATKQLPPDVGMNPVATRDVFINCNTGMTISPVEVRYSVGQAGGNAFALSLWNPTNNSLVLQLQSTSSNPSGYPLQWITLDCNGAPGCETGPVGGDPFLVSDDTARISVPAMSSVPLNVIMPTAPKSGSYPVTFIADDQSGKRYSASGNILIFSEGLDEFQAWQIVVLLGLAAYVMFSVAV